jgi:8-oxo-dGTP diphosphatase
MKYQYEFARPALAVDIVVFGYENNELFLLLIERGIDPFKGSWALPGGFLRGDETLKAAAVRELSEEAGVNDLYLEQLYTFDEVERDPRERVISVGYLALVKPSGHELRATTDAVSAKWFSVSKLPDLAFDHQKIVELALQRLRSKLRYEPLGFELLPSQFTLTQLQQLYETILGREIDKRNFRKKVLSLGVLRELDKKIEKLPHRAPTLYRLDLVAYRRIKKSGEEIEFFAKGTA